MLLTIHFLYTVVDVSAQYDSTGTCTVTVVRPNTLTATGGTLLNGTTDVRIHCRCDHNDGTARNTRWYGASGTRLVNSSCIAPYHILLDGNTKAVLVIPKFTESYTGTYTCGGNFEHDPLPPTATVNLTICKLIISTISYF